jgi:hypothetical protein
MNGRMKRVWTSILGACAWSFGLEVCAQEPVVSEDRFADALRSMESRMAELEESNARLEAELSVYGRPGTSHLTGMSPDAPGTADSFEELLQRTQQADERLAKIEESIQKDAEAAKKKKEEDAKKDKKWFEKYTIRGYAQFRVNDIMDNDGPAPAHYVGDSSIGNNQSFLIRRARLIFSGDVSDHLSLYFQPDFASSVPGSPDARGYFKTPSSITSCRRDERNLRRDERVVRVGQGVVFGIEAS